MTLNFGNDLFGEKGLFTKEPEKMFSLSYPHVHKRIATSGNAVAGTATFIAGKLEQFKDVTGFVTSVHLMNESGASRNSTVIIKNETTGVTLISGNVDIVDGGFFNYAYYFSTDWINPGDSVKFTVGNEGIGTANADGVYALAIPGSGFKPIWSTDGYIMDYGEFQSIYSVTDISVPVLLPHAAVVTDVIVTGSDSTESWDMYRCSLTNGDSVVSMATEDINSEDSSISYATINNGLYSYIIKSACDTGEVIHGARILYTYPDRHNSTCGYYEFGIQTIFKSDGEST